MSHKLLAAKIPAIDSKLAAKLYKQKKYKPHIRKSSESRAPNDEHPCSRLEAKPYKKRPS